ncbi:hypothetical protein BANRA_03886 [Acinetobacter baumannii]|nr:hypothetical protein BANRA_03886 [Acinetobacter baumannii]
MENLTAFSLFAIVASITPGPTNFIILSLSSHYKISLCTRQISQNPYPIRVLPS